MMSKFLWLLALSIFILFNLNTIKAQSQCDFFEGTITLTATGGNNAAGFSTKYYLTDTNGNIIEINNAPSFTDIVGGNYIIYAINYETAANFDDDVDNIAAITGDCFDVGEGFPVKVCDTGCDFLTGNNISFQILNAGNTTIGFSNQYILTNMDGLILEIKDTPNFIIAEMGNYNVYGLNYETASGIDGLVVGESITNINGVCYDLGVPYCFTVCPSECTWYADTYIFYAQGGNNGEEFTTVYLLTDQNGQIIGISDTPIFNDLIEGIHLVYPLNYQTAEGVTGLVIGNNIGNIEGSCFDIGYPLPFHYCPCGPECDTGVNTTFSFNSAGGNADTDNFATQFLLVDMLGDIIAISNMPEFTEVPEGQYQIIAINYKNTNVPTGLEVGDNLIAIAGTCLDFSEPICLNVCEDCPPIKCLPFRVERVE